MPIPPLPPGYRLPSYDPIIRFGPEQPPLGSRRRLLALGPLDSIEVKYSHGLGAARVRVLAPGEVRPVLQGFTSVQTTPPLRPEGALLVSAGLVMGRCVPAVGPLPYKMPESGKGSTR